MPRPPGPSEPARGSALDAVTVVALSDTHMRHRELVVPPCELLVHAGDFSRRGTSAETREFIAWMASQPAREKVLVAGNHDRFAELEPERLRELTVRSGIRYLFDEEVTLLGLRIWGSPVTPAFRSMAFNRERGAAIRRHWDAIPAGLDLLVTHGPPQGIGDRAFFGAHVGCEALMDAVRQRPPRAHVFGHIHEAAGEYRDAGLSTRFLNVAIARWLGGTRPAVTFTL